MEALGHGVTGIDSHPEKVRARQKSLAFRVIAKLTGPLDWAGTNRRILEQREGSAFDVLWVDKGLAVRPDTIRAIRSTWPSCHVVGYSPDDMMNRGNQSRAFLHALPHYDVFFTTKTYGVSELRALGCRRVVWVGNGFDPEVHRPVTVSVQDREALGGSVGFIGQWERERGDSICRLAENGIPVRVWGYSWERMRCRPGGLVLENRPLWEEDYARAICAFDINLCFLRKANRDLQTTRSIEIPACGAFMLAERTNEHLALFREGEEAEFFSSHDELVEKTRYYLHHSEERLRIAAAGRRRCVEGGYSNTDRMKQCLDVVLGNLPHPA